MSRILILARHGKAQARSEERSDFQRELTKAGRRSLRAWLPQASSMLRMRRCESIEVWTSPAARARQTAEEVARTFGVAAEPVERACLWDQDVDGFCASMNESTAACVVAVGHNPFVEEIALRFGGLDAHIATGGVVAIAFPDGFDFESGPAWGCERSVPGEGAAAAGSFAPDQPRLLWFVQGPRSQDWKTVCTIEDRIEQAAGRVEFCREAFLARPDDVKALHALRVSIRSLRSLLAFVAPFLDKRAGKALRQDLRGIVAQTSRLREYDVLRSQAEALEQPSQALVEACSRARDQECARVVRALGSKQVRKAVKRVRKSAGRLPWRDGIEQDGLPVFKLQDRFESLSRAIDEGFENIDFAEADAVHKLRKDAKRVRYVAENFGSLLGEAAADEAPRMVGVQDRLGALCDARVNVDIIADFPVKGLPDEALCALECLLERNVAFIDEFLESFACRRPCPNE